MALVGSPVSYVVQPVEAVIQDCIRELESLPSEEELAKTISYSPRHIARIIAAVFSRIHFYRNRYGWHRSDKPGFPKCEDLKYVTCGRQMVVKVGL